MVPIERVWYDFYMCAWAFFRNHLLITLGLIAGACASACSPTDTAVSTPVVPIKVTAQKVPAPQRFPLDWNGTWKGSCQSFSPGRTNDPFEMGLSVQPLVNQPTIWKWVIEYKGKDFQQTRNYELKQQDMKPGHYVVDEKNGIFLDNFWVGERVLLEQFSVGSSFLTIKHRLIEHNQMEVEFMIFGQQPMRQSAAGENQVKSYPLQTYQQCLLKR